MTRSPKDIAASVRQRLLNMARQTDRPFNEVLQYFAMERFLYRLSMSSHARKFILKGALMFNSWKLPSPRHTMDIDLLGKTESPLEAIAAVTRNVCLQDVEPDGLTFNPDTVKAERIIEGADYEGVRVRFQSSLGRARVSMQLDVAFGDVVFPSAILAEYPGMLDFPRPRLLGYTKESTVAEKLEAMVKLGVLNSRMKDFFDIWWLSQHSDFDGRRLGVAISKTFSKRETKIPLEPICLTAAFAGEPGRESQWKGFIRKNRLQNVPGRLEEVVGGIAIFLGPIIDALARGKSFGGRWHGPGPWR